MKRLIVTLSSFVLLLSLSIVLSSCDDSTSNPDNQGITLAGKILNMDNQPIQDALIRAVNASNAIISSDSTDDVGHFFLTNLPNDYENTTIEIIHPDYQYFSASLKELILVSNNDYITLSLVPQDSCCGWLIVELENAEGAAINEAEVRVNKGEEVIEKLYTNSNGEVKFDGLCEGNYWFRVAKEGYKVIEKEFSITDCDTTEFSLKMEAVEEEQCCGLLIVNVENADGEAVNDVEVRVNKGKEVIEKLYTNSDGFVMFDSLCEGDYWFRVAKEGYKVIEKEFSITDCDTVFKEISLEAIEEKCCNSIVKIFAKDSETGNYLNGAIVKMWLDGKLIEQTTVNNDGYAIFDGVCEGKVWFDILMEGYKGVEFYIVVGCDSTYRVNKELTPKESEECCTAKLKLRVLKNDTEIYLDDALIDIYIETEKIRSAYTDGTDNWVIFEELCAPKKYTIKVSKDGYKTEEFKMYFDECKTLQEHVWMKPE